MIFRKHLCGGFGILMSQKDQVEKNIEYQCCAKMVSQVPRLTCFWKSKWVGEPDYKMV